MKLALLIFCLFILASALFSEYLHQTKQKSKKTILDSLTILGGAITVNIMFYVLFKMVVKVFHIIL